MLLLVIHCVLSQEGFQKSLEHVFLLWRTQRVSVLIPSSSLKAQDKKERHIYSLLAFTTCLRFSLELLQNHPHFCISFHGFPGVNTGSYWAQAGSQAHPPCDICEMTSHIRGTFVGNGTDSGDESETYSCGLISNWL